MKDSTIFYHYTDFISDTQRMHMWGFDYKAIKKAYRVPDYSLPVLHALFQGLKGLAESKSERMKNRKFTILIGDFGEEFRLFGVGVANVLSTPVLDVVGAPMEVLKGFATQDYGVTPWVPFVPWYRYECGTVIEYVYENERIKAKPVSDVKFGTGLPVICRKWRSAEDFEMKEKYGGLLEK